MRLALQNHLNSWRLYVLAVFAAFAQSGCDTFESQPAQNIKPPIASTADIGRRIERLASDSFEGREPGTKGGQLASQYIADEMKEAGLVPMGDDGTYFQSVKLTESSVLPSSDMKISAGDDILLEADQDTNAVYWTKRLNETVSVSSSEIVFVGYGVVAPEYGWNDYAGLDVKDKTVIILVNDPGFTTQDDALFKGSSMTYYGRWTYKFEEAGRP